MNSLQSITISYSFVPVIGVPDLYQVIVPFEHPDTDLLEVYVQIIENNGILLTDMGVTVMRLSYTIDIDSDTTKKYLKSITDDQGLFETGGTITCPTSYEELEKSIGNFIQGLSKVLAIASLSRSVKESIFADVLGKLILTEAHEYNPIKNYFPIESKKDYTVNYKLGFQTTKRPIFLFAVNNGYNAREALGNILFFMNEKISFKSVVAYEDMDSITNKDIRKLTDIADKQFSSLDSFAEGGITYIKRELQEVS